MCGIAGIVAGAHELIDGGELCALGRALRHRGPDDHGFLVWTQRRPPAIGRHPDIGSGRIGLVHRRLSILDLSELGWQPMSSPDGRLHVVYNGEVYNYLELRKELEEGGHKFNSHSDTEVLLAAIASWGLRNAISRFEGMYAFALLNTESNTLTLARDPFGIKPLYYAFARGRFVFASEIKALLALQWIPRQADPNALLAYLTAGRSDEGEGTMFAGVRQLPAGGVIVLDVTGAARVDSQWRSWRPTVTRTLRVSRDEAATLVREAFFDSVGRHLRSDVPVGSALSGGLDSSSIVAGMRRAAPDLELHAFSYLAEDPKLTEERWVRDAARAASATVHEVHISSDALAHDVDYLIRSQDEPFGSTSIYAQYRIFQAAADAGVRVMLDGQGADELLGGYASFLGPRVAGLVGSGRLAAAVQLAWSSYGRADVDLGEVARYVVAASVPRAVKTRLSARIHADALPGWIATAWFDSRLPSLRVEAPDPGRDLRAHLARETETSLLALLRYEDRNSMAFSVESRVPFLTTKFAELCLSLPGDYLIGSDGTRKAVLRDAMHGIVPDSILHRRDKIGFRTPERALLTGANSWTKRVLESDCARNLDCIDLTSITARIAAGPNGAGVPRVPLWRILNLIRWAELLDVQFV
jgi:asparagine synthase (glutamine-hydrolysing)